MKIDIVSKYIYEYGNEEIIEIKDKEFMYENFKYISKDLILKIDNEKLEVIKNSDISYHKIYELNKETRSILNFNGNEIITKIKTHSLYNLENDYIIKSSEYTENNEKILDLEINIKIKGD
ncbi:hypothetical protein [Oceanivirga salmonicida]|uniref:hypothetical protein n=1 Tax=Oceanivirga salmonicida TaxID=1769291 RepID=UPI00082B559E|nr:hypothetical protein [Oceanivirga salmonicida]